MCFLVNYFFHTLFILSILRLAWHWVKRSQNRSFEHSSKPSPCQGGLCPCGGSCPDVHRPGLPLLRPPPGARSSHLPPIPFHGCEVAVSASQGGSVQEAAGPGRLVSTSTQRPRATAPQCSCSTRCPECPGVGTVLPASLGQFLAKCPFSADMSLSCGLGTILLLIPWLLHICKQPPICFVSRLFCTRFVFQSNGLFRYPAVFC